MYTKLYFTSYNLWLSNIVVSANNYILIHLLNGYEIGYITKFIIIQFNILCLVKFNITFCLLFIGLPLWNLILYQLYVYLCNKVCSIYIELLNFQRSITTTETSQMLISRKDIIAKKKKKESIRLLSNKYWNDMTNYINGPNGVKRSKWCEEIGVWSASLVGYALPFIRLNRAPSESDFLKFINENLYYNNFEY